MTTPHILRRTSLHQKIKLKKRQPSSKTLVKRNKFLYINCQLFPSHRAFLHHMRLYIKGKTNEFDKEPLRSRAYIQKVTFNQHLNRGGRINPALYPKFLISYNEAQPEPPTPPRTPIEEEEFITVEIY